MKLETCNNFHGHANFKHLEQAEYKNLFLRKNIKLTTCSIWFEGRSHPTQCGIKKKLSPYCQELLVWPSVRIRLPNCEHTKNLSQQIGFVTRFWNCRNRFKQAEASQEIKVKLNESRLLKFYQVKQLKENSTEISAEKILKEDSEFKELWNISSKQKQKKKKEKKRKILKFKELCLPDTLTDNFQQIAPKICNTLSFLFTYPN